MSRVGPTDNPGRSQRLRMIRMIFSNLRRSTPRRRSSPMRRSRSAERRIRAVTESASACRRSSPLRRSWPERRSARLACSDTMGEYPQSRSGRARFYERGSVRAALSRRASAEPEGAAAIRRRRTRGSSLGFGHCRAIVIPCDSMFEQRRSCGFRYGLSRERAPPKRVDPRSFRFAGL
jgi:hypothetical protein